MENIINFSDAKKRQKKKIKPPRPAFPTNMEVECFRAAVDSYKRASGGQPLPYWMFDGRELKSIWNDMIVPLAEDEGVDPWDIAGILFANSHGMDFVYENGKPVRVTYQPEEDG